MCHTNIYLEVFTGHKINVDHIIVCGDVMYHFIKRRTSYRQIMWSNDKHILNNSHLQNAITITTNDRFIKNFISGAMVSAIITLTGEHQSPS